MAKQYKINTDNTTNNLSKLISNNQAKQNGTSSTTPSQTVKITSPTGTTMNVTAGSQTHQNYLKNNPSAIDQSSVQTTYSTPDTYSNSGNVKTFDQSGQQTSSASGYTGAVNPSFNVSNSVTDMVNQIKNQEALMRQTWATADKTGYNDMVSSRNTMTGQLLDLITKESGGNASLGEIESILGRRLENQELGSYREAYSNGSALQGTQLNNLWEHDFATRNNGENYQYMLNYLNNGTGANVLGQSTLNYLNGMTPEALATFTQGQADSLAATQNYFTQRATGWTPEYVNNTANPLPWGEIDAGDIINNGGKGTQAQIEAYLWALQNPNFDYTTMTPSPLDVGNTVPTTPATALPAINVNVTNPNANNSGLDATMLAELMNQYKTTPQQNLTQGALSSQTTQDDILNKYLMSIWNGGL